MATRTALLNGNVINRDTDFSKYIETVSEPGVIEGFAVSSSSVAVGKARVPCERTNGDIIYALVYNNAAQSISGDGDVYILVSQEIIDNGELGNEDGTGIATIEVGTMPAKNALKLATKSGSTITDARNMIKTVGELNTAIGGINDDIEDLDERVMQLEEKGAINRLEQSGIVGENYLLTNKLVEQKTPVQSNAGLGYNVGDVNGHKEVHIQRIGSGIASNQLKLNIKKVGSPNNNLIIEVRKGTKVDVSTTEAYWYGGGSVVASGSIAYGTITTSFAEYTVTLNANFGETRGELLDIVLYQANNTVDSSHYYVVGCDSVNYGEAFSCVGVNGNTRTRSKYMPYCVSNGFESSLLIKGQTDPLVITSEAEVINHDYGSQQFLTQVEQTGTCSGAGKLRIDCSFSVQPGESGSPSGTVKVYVDNTMIWYKYYGYGIASGAQTVSFDYQINTGGTHTIKIQVNPAGSGYKYCMFYNVVMGAYFTEQLYPTIGIGIPVESKNIGEMSGINLFGKSDNPNYNSFFMGFQTTGAVTTGSITPGNFVGYLDIGGYKIPYYT